MDTVKVSIGGRSLVVRPLSLGALELVQRKYEEMDKRGGGPTGSPENIQATAEVLAAALSRGNEGVTVEWLKQEIELPQIAPTLQAISEVSGLVRAPSGEAASP